MASHSYSPTSCQSDHHTAVLTGGCTMIADSFWGGKNKKREKEETETREPMEMSRNTNGERSQVRIQTAHRVSKHVVAVTSLQHFWTLASISTNAVHCDQNKHFFYLEQLQQCVTKITVQLTWFSPICCHSCCLSWTAGQELKTVTPAMSATKPLKVQN